MFFRLDLFERNWVLCRLFLMLSFYINIKLKLIIEIDFEIVFFAIDIEIVFLYNVNLPKNE